MQRAINRRSGAGGFVHRNRPGAREPLRQILAVDELHHERDRCPGVLVASTFYPCMELRRAIVGLAETVRRKVFDGVHLGDMRMIQRGQRARLALEARQSLRIPDEPIRQHLDRHVAMQLCIARTINVAHSARADQGDDLVAADTRPGREAHHRGII